MTFVRVHFQKGEVEIARDTVLSLMAGERTSAAQRLRLLAFLQAAQKAAPNHDPDTKEERDEPVV